MFETIISHIHNDFEARRVRGHFEIVDGGIDLPGVHAGEYFRIIGSRFNDGVYRYPAEGLTDEAFEGAIALLRPPRAFLRLVAEIEAWRAKYGGAAEGPYQSESVIGVYSYTKEGAGWQKVFAPRLDEWRKIA